MGRLLEWTPATDGTANAVPSVASIEAAENLSIGDFQCRHLTVEPLWITMAERFLIEHYQPPWNVCIEGFGLHDPARGRHQGETPWWDDPITGCNWRRISTT